MILWRRRNIVILSWIHVLHEIFSQWTKFTFWSSEITIWIYNAIIQENVRINSLHLLQASCIKQAHVNLLLKAEGYNVSWYFKAFFGCYYNRIWISKENPSVHLMVETCHIISSTLLLAKWKLSKFVIDETWYGIYTTIWSILPSRQRMLKWAWCWLLTYQSQNR